MLRQKWRRELGHRFGVDARIANAQQTRATLEEASRNRTQTSFALVASMQGLRRSKNSAASRDLDAIHINLPEWVFQRVGIDRERCVSYKKEREPYARPDTAALRRSLRFTEWTSIDQVIVNDQTRWVSRREKRIVHRGPT